MIVFDIFVLNRYKSCCHFIHNNMLISFQLQETGTNMDIIYSFLAKPLDKHGVTLVRITYPPVAIGHFHSTE